MDNFTNPENNTQNTAENTYSYDYMNNTTATQDVTTSYSQPGTFAGESAAWAANNQAEQATYSADPYANTYVDPMAGYTAVPEKKKGIGFSITALVLGILSVLCCCLSLGWITAIPGIIFGIIAIAKKCAGKGCAIAGIICSAIAIVSAIVSLIATIAFGASMPSLMDTLEDYGYSSSYDDYYDYYY